MKAVNIDGSYLTYKGKPLVRKGNDLFYGDLSDDYYLSMMIMTQKSVKIGEATVEVPDQILVQVCSKDGKPVKQKLVKDGLYEAFDLGCVWLEKMLVS
ncbi:MAG: hypothetical protein J6X72_02985 [Clostridia bacterium]|nr:hypothetical protein [Clostridia bacterium]